MTDPSGATDDELFARRDEDPDAREELLNAHLPLARYLARRFAGRGEATEDLEQVAGLALLNAIDRFDPSRNVRFSTFASVTIVGELKRHLRDRGWSVRVPRALQELVARVNGAIRELSQDLGRSPTAREVARRIDVSEDEVMEALEAARAYTADSLDAPVGGGEGAPPVAETLAAHDDRFEHIEGWASVAPVIDRLPERERTILYLRFFEDRSQSQIAEQLGISQMHVSRLLAKALATIREGVPD